METQLLSVARPKRARRVHLLQRAARSDRPSAIARWRRIDALQWPVRRRCRSGPLRSSLTVHGKDASRTHAKQGSDRMRIPTMRSGRAERSPRYALASRLQRKVSPVMKILQLDAQDIPGGTASVLPGVSNSSVSAPSSLPGAHSMRQGSRAAHIRVVPLWSMAEATKQIICSPAARSCPSPSRAGHSPG